MINLPTLLIKTEEDTNVTPFSKKLFFFKLQSDTSILFIFLKVFISLNLCLKYLRKYCGPKRQLTIYIYMAKHSLIGEDDT